MLRDDVRMLALKRLREDGIVQIKVGLELSLCRPLLKVEKLKLLDEEDNEKISSGNYKNIKFYSPVFKAVTGDEYWDEYRRLRNTELLPKKLSPGATVKKLLRQQFATLNSVRDTVAAAIANLFNVTVHVEFKSFLASVAGGEQQGDHHDSVPCPLCTGNHLYPEYGVIVNIDPSAYARLYYYPRSHLFASLSEDDADADADDEDDADADDEDVDDEDDDDEDDEDGCSSEEDACCIRRT